MKNRTRSPRLRNACAAVIEALEERRLFTVFTVTSIADSGAGTLRQAILDANATSGEDSIAFNIAGAGVHTITPLTQLPSITDALTIDGTTQAGYLDRPLIELSGAKITTTYARGLDFTNRGTTGAVKSLIVNGFSGVGIDLDQNVTGALVEGCYIGTTADGTAAAGNGLGVLASGGTIGGPIFGNANQIRNIISGNTIAGVQLDTGSTEVTTLENNWIGTDATGEKAIANTIGVYVHEQHAFVDANIIAGNVTGILGDFTFGSTADIWNGSVGESPTGKALPNTGVGIHLTGGSYDVAANYIAYNGGAGVFVENSSTRALIESDIFSNGALGIDLAPAGVTANDPGDVDTGPNSLLNFPTILSTSTNGQNATITATYSGLSNTAITFDFYAFNPTYTADSPLGTATATSNSSGIATVVFQTTTSYIQGMVLTATASDGGVETSEFSPAFNVPPAAPAGLTAFANSGTQVTLTWGDESYNETGFEIDRSTTSNFTNATSFTTAANVASYVDNTVVAGTTYYYRVRAFNIGGSNVSGYSIAAPITPTASSALAPSAPTNIAGVANSANQITVTWTDTSNNETGFEIQRSATSTFNDSTTNTTASNTMSYVDSTLIKSTYYYYRVRAVNGSLASAYTKSVKIKTLASGTSGGGGSTGTVFATATSLAGTAVTGPAVSLTWKDNASGETGYEIEVSTASNFSTIFSDITVPTPNLAAYKVTGLAAKGYYYFRVRAISSTTPTLDSAWSSSVKIKTLSA